MVQEDQTIIDVEQIRKDFPILKHRMNGKSLVYLDSAATSQKPKQVISAINEYYTKYNANIHRGIYKISEQATAKYIESKQKVASFINAPAMEQIIYTRNTTESLNIVALSLGEKYIGPSEHILISDLEHHSNIVPWQLISKKRGATLKYAPINQEKTGIDMDRMLEQIEKEPAIVSITHASNVLGTISDVKRISKAAHEHGAIVVIDAAQSVPHIPIDVKQIDADFVAFSSHKMLGPSGVGVLYAKESYLEEMEPVFSGGDMIHTVTHQTYSWNALPWKFEAGTPNIEGAIGFGAAIDYLNNIGMQNIEQYSKNLTTYAIERLSNMRGVHIYGHLNKPDERIGVISFEIDGVHPHDIAQVFDSEGIAIRAGHHCAMPLITESLGKSALARMSFYIYNTQKDIDRAVKAIKKAQRIFKKG